MITGDSFMSKRLRSVKNHVQLSAQATNFIPEPFIWGQTVSESSPFIIIMDQTDFDTVSFKAAVAVDEKWSYEVSLNHV